MTNGVLILDGGLATELERAGHNLDHPLWSAKIMLEDRESIKAVHRSYLEAGANCLITASYQVSYPGCDALGMTEDETTELLEDTVRVARETINEFCEFCEFDEMVVSNSPNSPNTPHYSVAASIGPYGAYLSDGSEYTGDYGITKDELREFHAKRFRVLAATDADILACETIPSSEEAEVILRLLESTKGRNAWFSFSCRDGDFLNDGTPISECAAMLSESDQVAAIGVNCTAPRYVSDLIRNIKTDAPSKPVVVYPNSGESYIAENGSWEYGDKESTHDTSLAELAEEWHSLGAQLIGGCCRTGPEDIRQIGLKIGN